MNPEQFVYLCALAVAGLFTGGSLFISLVDVPARAALEPKVGRQHFREMYPRATALQAPLAAGGSVLGWALYLVGGGLGGLAAGALLGAVVVYTLVAIMPTNRQLMDSRVELQGDDISGLLAVWARRHAVRTLLGGAAYLALLAGI
jgi:hypothetical protein